LAGLRVADLGCGSGVLALAALAFGAAAVAAVDTATFSALCEESRAMLATARYAEALDLLVRAKRSTTSGHAPGLCAPLTTLYFDGRAGVPKQARRAFEHATQGGHESCADCTGTLARCLRAGDGAL
jgi:predicted nicotinamide N-methyase